MRLLLPLSASGIGARKLAQRCSVFSTKSHYELTMPVESLHSTIGVYVGCQQRSHWKFNGVEENSLKEHVQYNLLYRPGRGFFVDGKCVNRGYLSEEEATRIEVEMAEVPHIPTKDTAPYH